MTIRRDAATRDWLLRCNSCITTVERFAPTTRFDAIASWIKRFGWRATYHCKTVWIHECPACQRARLAPADYFERLQA